MYLAKNSAERVAQETQALDLRLKGLSYERIGEEMGINHQTAYTRVHDALHRYVAPKAEDIRNQETERHQRIIEAAGRIMNDPKSTSAEMMKALSIIQSSADSIARLHGANAPVKVEQAVTVTTPVDSAVDDLARQMGMLDAPAAG